MSKVKQNYISPISIDLGAANTGVYMAHYKEWANIKEDDIDKKGIVYKLEKDKYTLLMADRTANRHQRRGFDRRQMAKRLFKLVWENELKLPWDNDTQQTISFLLNRRGFTFIKEDYNENTIRVFPKDCYDELPDILKQDKEGYEYDTKDTDTDTYDMATRIEEWAKDKETLKEKHDALAAKTKEVKNNLVVLVRLKKLREYCEIRKGNADIPPEKSKGNGVKLSQLSKWIFDKWMGEGIKGLEPHNSDANIDMVAVLNAKSPEQCEVILNSIPSNIDESNKNEKDSLWNFQMDAFNRESEEEKGNFDKKTEKTAKNEHVYRKAHINHLAYAIDLIKTELESGGRYRSKYFQEVKDALECETHTHGYLKRFCKKLSSKSFINPYSKEPLNAEAIHNLIGHISNLELKPLRKYFNNKVHIGGDKWLHDDLQAKYSNWLLKEWRVGKKDKDKGRGGKYDYIVLKQDYKKYEGKLVRFWLDTAPSKTIPPYQDNNNRHPPRCQSLLLNATCLNEKYPEWKDWLKELQQAEGSEEHIADYSQQLKDIKSSSGKGYFDQALSGNALVDSGKRTMEQLDARVMQFILDRAKKIDILNLNEIYSLAKKLRQLKNGDPKREKEKYVGLLNVAISESKLPKTLKTKQNLDSSDIFNANSFFHFICGYYRERQRARDGRIFIHPMYKKSKNSFTRTTRYDDKDCLMTYCNHKPRQKRHQIIYDLCSILQITPIEFRKLLDGKDDEEKIINWLDGIKGLKTRCGAAAKWQKDMRGSLKIAIGSIYGDIYRYEYRQSAKLPEKKKDKDNVLKKNLNPINKDINKSVELYNLCEDASKSYIALLSKAGSTAIESIEHKAYKNKAISIYELAKLNNIVYKDRSGNAKTCPACSLDNAMRMHKVDMDSNELVAKAQRLPAIETRVIDGAVKRLARIVGEKIAEHKWQQIKDKGSLDYGGQITIPIVTESNRFEFEPSLHTLKGKSGKAVTSASYSKEDRIKHASSCISTNDGRSYISAYGGKGMESGEFNKATEEIDHIIPRSSQWGLLNDEANLICVTKEDNQRKGNKIYRLKDLDDKYKNSIFHTADDKAIEGFITSALEDDQGEFKFKNYNSFINLSQEEQIAFRHALFLPEESGLRLKVVNAIDNRNRAFVNGTQRYFAEVVANEIYKKACASGHAEHIRFDYFSYEASSYTKQGGVYEWRKELVNFYRPNLREYSKEENKIQHNYSHLIDAQVVFCMALNDHQAEGTFKINLAKYGLWSKVEDGGEMVPDKRKHKVYGGELYDIAGVNVDGFNVVELSRNLPEPSTSVASHRPLFNENSVAMHFLKLMEVSYADSDTSDYYTGFLDMTALKDALDNDEEYTVYAKKLSQKDIEKNLDIYKKFPSQNANGSIILEGYGKKKAQVKLYALNKTAVFKYLVDNFNTALDEREIDRLLDKNNHESREKSKIYNCIKDLQYFTKRKNVIDGNSIYKTKENDKKCCNMVNPQIEHAWNSIKSKVVEGESIHDNVRRYFLDEGNGRLDYHQKVRKNFSLPVAASKGILIGKHDWRGREAYQCRPLSNDFSQDIHHFESNDNNDNRLSNIYRNRNMFISGKSFVSYMKYLHGIEPNHAINANDYYPCPIPEELEYFIDNMENKRTDKSRTTLRFHLKPDVERNFLEFKCLIQKFPTRPICESQEAIKIIDEASEIEDLENYIERIASKSTEENKKYKKSVFAIKNAILLYKKFRVDKTIEYICPKAKFTRTP